MTLHWTQKSVTIEQSVEMDINLDNIIRNLDSDQIEYLIQKLSVKNTNKNNSYSISVDNLHDQQKLSIFKEMMHKFTLDELNTINVNRDNNTTSIQILNDRIIELEYEIEYLENKIDDLDD